MKRRHSPAAPTDIQKKRRLDPNGSATRNEVRGKESDDESTGKLAAADDSEGLQNNGFLFVPMVPGCMRKYCPDPCELAARRKQWFDAEAKGLEAKGLILDGPPTICLDGMSIPWRRIIGVEETIGKGSEPIQQVGPHRDDNQALRDKADIYDLHLHALRPELFPSSVDERDIDPSAVAEMDDFILTYAAAQSSATDSILNLYARECLLTIRTTETIPVRTQYLNILRGCIYLSDLKVLANTLGLEPVPPKPSSLVRTDFMSRTFIGVDGLRAATTLLALVPISTNPATLMDVTRTPEQHILVTIHDQIEVEEVGRVSYDRSMLIAATPGIAGSARWLSSILSDSLTFRQPSVIPTIHVSAVIGTAALPIPQQAPSPAVAATEQIEVDSPMEEPSQPSQKALGKRRAIGERPSEDVAAAAPILVGPSPTSRSSSHTSHLGDENESPTSLHSGNVFPVHQKKSRSVEQSPYPRGRSPSAASSVNMNAPTAAPIELSSSEEDMSSVQYADISAADPSSIRRSSHQVSPSSSGSSTSSNDDKDTSSILTNDEPLAFQTRYPRSQNSYGGRLGISDSPPVGSKGLFTVKDYSKIQLPKYGRSKGRRLLPFRGEAAHDYVAVSHLGDVNYVKNGRWSAKRSIGLEEPGPQYVLDACVTSPYVVVPFSYVHTKHIDCAPPAPQVELFQWKLSNPVPEHRRPKPTPHDWRGISAVTGTSDGFYSGGHDHELILWTLKKGGRVEHTRRLKSEHTSAIRSLTAFSHRPWLFSAGSGPHSSKVSVLDVQGDKVIRHIPLDHDIVQIHQLPDKPNLIMMEAATLRDQFKVAVFDERAQLKSTLHFGCELEKKARGMPLTKGGCWADLFGKGIGEWTCRIWDIRNAEQYQDIEIASSNAGSHETAAHVVLQSSGIVTLRNHEVLFAKWSLC